MMKKITLFCFLLLALNSQAQVCELPNGNAEVWIDYTAELGLGEQFPAETVIAPEGFFSVFRLIFSDFLSLFETLSGEELGEVAPNLLGVQRSEDASEGEFAMQLGADEVFPLVDLVTAGACVGDLPSAITLDLKHVGDVEDTLLILGAFGEMPGIPEDETELDDYRAIFAQEITANTSVEYQKITIPVEDLETEIAADSFSLLILLSSNEVSIDTGASSYFLIDNIQFQGAGSTSLEDVNLPNQVSVYPTLFHDEITIENENELLEAIVYSIDGRRITSLTIPNGLSYQDLSQITQSGTYFLKMMDPNTRRSKTQLIIKQ